MSTSDFFPATGWGTIVGARGDAAALERLLTRYRRPILLEIESRTDCSQHELEDLTQQFIENCLRRSFLKTIDPRKGRFRSFVKKCIINFLHDIHRKKRAEPLLVSLDETDAEGHRVVDPPGEIAGPEESLDIQWAHQVLHLSLEALEQECMAARRGSLFLRLKSFLHTDPVADSYEKVAFDLRMKEGAVRTSVHRMRQRLGEIIRHEIIETVASEDELCAELRYFLDLLGRNVSVTSDVDSRMGS